MPSNQQIHEEVYNALGRGDLSNSFFTELETEELKIDSVREKIPELVAHWEIVAKLQSVPVVWVMAVELSLAGMLSPTAALYPMQSITIYPLTWCFLLHPGSTQTSGLLRLYQDVVDTLEIRINQARYRLRQEWAQHNPNAPADQENPFKGDVSICMGAGSLEGEGKEKSLKSNLGRSIAILTEGKRFITWLTNEGSLNESIVTELFERAKWKRTTLDGQRSFTLFYPYFMVFGAIHLKDILPLSHGDDALGLKGRIRSLYTRPSSKRAAEIREANDQHNMNRGLQERLVESFLPLALEHLPEHTAADKFEILKGYPMRAYSFSQVGKQVFDATFDYHVALQEEHYLKDHNLAKAHGKKKTSNLRFSFQLHLLDEARKGHRGDTWSMEVSEDSVNCGNDIGEFYNLISDKTEAFFCETLRFRRVCSSYPWGAASKWFCQSWRKCRCCCESPRCSAHPESKIQRPHNDDNRNLARDG